MMELIFQREAYLLFVVPVVAGIYLMLSHRNFLKAVVGLYLVQTGVIFFFVLLSVREGATVPIVDPDIVAPLANPLPHALMVTAIVVGIATIGVALAIIRRIQAEAGTIQDAADEAEST
jgi:multicomponent Na+:H+ antiporter subunit C